MSNIKIYTNLVVGGWSAKDLETGIGGSEEKLIELSEELVRLGHKVTVYMNGEHGEFNGIIYKDQKEFRPYEPCDTFISFKAPNILSNTINSYKTFHLTTEIEPEWPKYLLNNIDGVFTISHFHNAFMRPHSEKFQTQYLWADFERMDRNKVEKESGSMLYSSSFDRGLEELLVNWPLMKEKLGVKKLYITYGWDFMARLIRNNPHLASWKVKMEELMKQEGVELLGRLSNDDMCKMYWKCQYWALPLNNPQSELFCINAVKAQYAGCIPVVRKIGALQETVGECINFDELLGRPNQKSTYTNKSIEKNKKYVEKFGMKTRVNELVKVIL